MADKITQLRDVLRQRKSDLPITDAGDVARVDEINRTLDTIEELKGDGRDD